MAAVCGRFHLNPADYWLLLVDEEQALVDFMNEEDRAKQRAARRKGRG